MEFSRKRIIKLVVTFVFLCCMLFTNFVAIRLILRYGVDTYFYDKLLVAYTFGGAEGLKLELGKIPLTDKSPREIILAKDFTVRLKTLTDPGAFLKDKVLESRQMIATVRNLRNVAIFIMLILFGWKLFVNHITRKKIIP